jgi:ABC-2 type transport system permease protein
VAGLRSVVKLSWIELKLFLREPTTLVFTFAFPIVILFVMGEIFGAQETGREQMFRGFPALDYYVPAYVGLVTMSVGVIMLPARLTGYRAGGVLRRFRASLVPVWAVLGSQVLAGLALAVVGAALVWVFGDLVYDVRVPAGGVQLAASFLVSFAAFASIGALLGAAMPSPRAAQGAGLMLFFVMLFLSGAGPPVEVMSDTMSRIADFLPLTYAVVAIQDAWNGVGWGTADLLVLACIAVVAGWLSLRVYRWD